MHRRVPRAYEEGAAMESNLSERLRSLFDKVRRPDGRRWTLQEVAQATGLSVSYLWRLRSGRAANPTRAVLERIAAFFGVPVSFFLEGDEGSALPELATGSDSQVVALLDEAMAAYSKNQLAEAETLARRAVQEAEAAKDRLLAGRAQAMLAHILAGQGKAEEARAAVREALRLLGGPKAGPSWARAVITLAYVEYLQERFSHAYFHARRALAAIEVGEGDDHLRLTVLHWLGTIARRVGRPQEAVAYLEQARPLAQQAGLRFVVANSLSLGLAYLDCEQPDKAARLFEEALELCVRAGRPNDAARAQHNLGLVYEKMGRWVEAIEYLTKSLGSNEALGDIRVILYDHMELGWCYANIGQREMALRHAQAALALAQEHDWAGDRARAHWHLGRVLAKLGDVEEAISHYEAALRLLEEMELDAELPRVQLEAGDLLMQQGDVARAAQLYRKAAHTVLHTSSLQRYLLAKPLLDMQEEGLLPSWSAD